MRWREEEDDDAQLEGRKMLHSEFKVQIATARVNCNFKLPLT